MEGCGQTWAVDAAVKGPRGEICQATNIRFDISDGPIVLAVLRPSILVAQGSTVS